MTQIAPTTLLPSMIATGLFGLSALWHLVLMCKFPQKFFIPFLLGAIFQVVGYAFRIVYAEGDALMPYIIQSLFILIAPIFYAASIYGLLEKLIIYVKAESTIPLRPTLITKLFLIGDILAFIMQSTGGGMQAMAANSGDLSMSQTGADVVVIGLSIQFVFFFFFIVLTILFDVRTRSKKQKFTQGNWRLLLRVLEVSIILLLIRSVYRFIEYTEGYGGFLMQHELYFLIFDGVMMLLTQLLYNLVYPAKTLIKMKKKESPGTEMHQVKLLEPLQP